MSENSEAGQDGEARSPSDLPWGPWAPWHPPASLWHLSFFLVLTFGFYLPFWLLRVAEDLEAHGETGATADIKPWRTALAAAVPVYGWFRIWWLIRKLGDLLADGLVRPRTNPAALAVLAALALAAWHGALAHLIALRELGTASLSLFALAIGLLVLAAALIQHRFNLYKESQEVHLWSGAPYRLSGGEATVLAFVAILWGYGVFGNKDLISREWNRAQGEPLRAGQEVRGASGLYTLTLPEEGWVRVDPDTIQEGADLSLYGAERHTYLLTYLRCNGTSVNSRVEFRRERQRGALAELTITEERSLDRQSELPVSYALYAGHRKRSGGPKASWVATLAKDDILVEVIGATGGEREDLAAVEKLVKSLRIDEEATSCAN